MPRVFSQKSNRSHCVPLMVTSQFSYSKCQDSYFLSLFSLKVLSNLQYHCICMYMYIRVCLLTFSLNANFMKHEHRVHGVVFIAHE